MTITRRQFQLFGVGALGTAVSSLVYAQSYPSRPIRLIVGFPAGGIADVFARLAAQWFSFRLSQPFVVENKVGSASNFAAAEVAKADPDGHTLFLVTATNAINASLYRGLSFDLVSDFAPVACMYRYGPGVMVVNPAFPAKSVPEFIAYAKTNPGRINMASAGVGTTQHLYGELFKLLAGVDMVHLPYRGAPQAITDLIAGHVHVMFDTLGNTIQHVKSGTLRPLGVTTDTRVPSLPDTPTIAEFVAGYEGSGWQGISAPKNTPPQIIDRLNREMNRGLGDPHLKARIEELGYAGAALSPTEFGTFIAQDVAKWAHVVRAAGLKPG